MTQQAPYPAPYPAPTRTSSLAIWSLVLGILGFFCCPYFVISAGASVTGFLARRQIRDSRGLLKGEGIANAGLALGLVSIVVGATVWIIYGANITTFRLETG